MKEIRHYLLGFVEVSEKQAGWQSSGPDFQRLEIELHSHRLAFVARCHCPRKNLELERKTQTKTQTF
jgi:hypothetical protein